MRTSLQMSMEVAHKSIMAKIALSNFQGLERSTAIGMSDCLNLNNKRLSRINMVGKVHMLAAL